MLAEEDDSESRGRMAPRTPVIQPEGGGAKRGDVNPIEFVLLLGLVRGRKSRGEGRKKGRGIGRE